MKHNLLIYKQVLSELKAVELCYVFRHKISASLEMFGSDVREYAMSYLETVFEYQESFASESAAELDSMINELNNLASQYGSDDDRDSCERISRLILKLKDNHPMACNNLAAFHIDRGELEEALELLQKIMISDETRKDQNHLMAIFDNYYNCLDGLGLHERIIGECQDTMEVFPELKSLLLKWIGIAKIKEYQLSEGLSTLLQAEALVQADSEIKLAIAEYYEKIGDYETCKKYCYKALRQDSKNTDAYYQLGMACLFSGEREEAKKYLLESYKIDPHHLGIQYDILDMLCETDKLGMPIASDLEGYIEGLIESGESKRIINEEITAETERLKIEKVREEIDRLFSEA